MSICPSCKAVNPDGYQFCQFCGVKLAAIALNILGDEAMLPATVITKPIDLEDMSGELKNQVVEFASSQIDEYQELPIELDTQGVANLEMLSERMLPEMSMVADLPTYSSIGLDNIYINYAGKTDLGSHRDRNEDDFVTIFQTRSINGKSQISDRSQRGLFVLCDGMGGHAGGEVASAIAVNAITDQFRPFWIDTLPGKKKLNEVIEIANQAIFDRNEAEQKQALSRMGTTLVMLALHDLDVIIAHVGDSRIYQVTNSLEPQLQQLTRDHEVLNQLIDLGMEFEEAIARADAHQLTQALGPNPSDHLEPTIQSLRISEATLFLLCSDGLCDNDVIENNWRSHLLPILNRGIDLQTGLNNLIDLGNRDNGHDNLTAILILCHLEAAIDDETTAISLPQTDHDSDE
jgi:serine/threonine protein phosphatase PrpC